MGPMGASTARHRLHQRPIASSSCTTHIERSCSVFSIFSILTITSRPKASRTRVTHAWGKSWEGPDGTELHAEPRVLPAAGAAYRPGGSRPTSTASPWTGLLGADVSRDTWLAGLAISSSKGDGPFKLTSATASNRPEGKIESTLTALYPYARFELTDRVDAWGIAGLGTGDLTIREDGGSPIRTDIGMTKGASAPGASSSRPEPTAPSTQAQRLRLSASRLEVASGERRASQAAQRVRKNRSIFPFPAG